MKKLLLLAAAALLLLPVHAQAYSISYTIDSVAPGLEYNAAVTGGNTLSFSAKSVAAVTNATITGTYTITGGPGDAPIMERNDALFDHTLTAFFDSDTIDDMTKVRLEVSLPKEYAHGMAYWHTGDPDVDGGSVPTGLFETGIAYTFAAIFTNAASGYGEASFNLTVPQNAATPIPGAVWLLGSGMVGLVGLRRKMKGSDA